MGAKHSFAAAFAKSTPGVPNTGSPFTRNRSAREPSTRTTSARADVSTPPRTRGQKLSHYLPVLLLVLALLGLAFVLGGFVLPQPAPTVAIAGENEAAKKNVAGQSNTKRFLATPAADVPLLERLLERQTLLDEREKQLNTQEEALHDLQQQLEEKLATLTMLRTEIGALVEEKEAFEEKRFAHLVKVYEGMKPAEAAPLIELLNEQTAVRLFYRMEEKKVSRILGFLNPEIAAKLSERLAILQQKAPDKTAQ